MKNFILKIHNKFFSDNLDWSIIFICNQNNYKNYIIILIKIIIFLKLVSYIFSHRNWISNYIIWKYIYPPYILIQQFAIFRFDKVGEDVLITPAWVALRCPIIVIVRRSSRIYHEIHHGATTDRPASWQIATAVLHR